MGAQATRLAESEPGMIWEEALRKANLRSIVDDQKPFVYAVRRRRGWEYNITSRPDTIARLHAMPAWLR